MSNSQEISYEEWEAQHKQIERWVAQLGEHLKVDKASVAKALLDWVVVNGENDWLKLAAESDAAMGDYGHGELSEFLRLATLAWRDAWGEQGVAPQSNVLDDMQNLIDHYREQDAMK